MKYFMMVRSPEIVFGRILKAWMTGTRPDTAARQGAAHAFFRRMT
jgi:hypothetical protein